VNFNILLKLSPLSKLGYTIFFQVKTTTHFTRLTPVKLFIGCFFFFVQLINYIISKFSLLFTMRTYNFRVFSNHFFRHTIREMNPMTTDNTLCPLHKFNVRFISQSLWFKKSHKKPVNIPPMRIYS
jgi:hypothetical protein